MRLDWKTLPLEECVERLIDYRGKSPRKTTAGIPLVTAKIVKGGRLAPVEEYIAASDYDEWMRRGLPQPGDVVITTEAPLGEVAQLDERRVALAQRIIALRGKSGVLDNTFLKFLLQSEFVQSQLMARASGSTVLGIRQSELRKVSLRLPPYDQQRAIARILGSLDDKIELNRRMNRTLESMARALFKSWFVDFDPVHANAAGTPTLPPDLAALFPAKFQPSDLGDVPKGWQITRLDSLLMLHYGKALPKTKRRPGSVPVYGSGGITGEHDTSLVCGPGIIVGRKGSVGTLYWEDQDFFPIDTTFYVEPSPSVSLHYLMNLLETLGLKAMNTDAAVPGLNRENVYRLTVAKPPEPLIERFHHLVAGLRTRIESNARESRTLAALRDSLLPKLLSGELSVGDASEVAA